MLVEKVNHGAFSVVTIRRPESLNALNREVLDRLDEVLDSLVQEVPRVIRAVVVTGEGSKAFVAGADIKQMAQLSASEALSFSQRGQEVFNKLAHLPVPVVAAVNGYALGGGLELALACDWIWATPNAVFGLPEVGLGLIPGFGGTARLVQKIGPSKAYEMILTGRRLNAEEAMRWGLINEIFASDQLLPQTVQRLESLLQLGPLAVSQAKRLLLKGQATWLHQALEDERESFADLFNLKDVREGMQAFMQKRKPQFKGE
ncbi:MAG: enoyl-CoA hydratase-related protein [Bdellovibrionaceae bacterium]|nr:enoyl-CoA hydratase-related protein [Pseudobdellovibrionaceae bacterium]MDW8190327.1 enoyl-CoA hydratase-related protein [Pseudobdellovibrionaceae bacterium]